MSDDADTQRAIGHLQASVEILQAEVESLRDQVGELLKLAATAKGGWRTLVSVGGISASTGAAVAAFLHRWL